MTEKRSNSLSDAKSLDSQASSTLTQNEFGLPSMSLHAPVSSSLTGQIAWQPPADQARIKISAATAKDAHYRRQEFTHAWERYERGVATSSSDGRHHYRLGMAAWEQGRPELAERNLLEALRLAPNYADAHNALGRWCLEAGQVHRALQHTEAALLLDPKDIEYVITRAAVLIADSKARAAWELIKPLLNAGASHPRLAILDAHLAPRPSQDEQAMQV